MKAMEGLIFGSNDLYEINTSFINNESIKLYNQSEEKDEEYEMMYEAPVAIVTLLSLFYGGISIIAVVGNSLVMWVVATTKQMHTVTNMYIANLALADVIIGVFCIPFQFQAALLQSWNLPEFMCAFCPFVQVISVNVSIFTLTAIAVDRYGAIINPLKKRPSKFVSKAVLVFIWVAAISFAIPIAVAFRVVIVTDLIRRDEDSAPVNITRPFCENENLTPEQLLSYRYYLVFVQYVVPLCVISFVYIQMAIRLWGSKTPGNAQDSRDTAILKNKKKVIKMLIIVVVVFGLCWLPLQTYNILYVTWSNINEYQYINIIWFCCDWLAMSNSCYNPFIYGIYNEKFKREFNRRFQYCHFKLNKRDYDKTISVTTRDSSLRLSSTRQRNNTICQRNILTTSGNGYNMITTYDKQKSLLNNQYSEQDDNANENKISPGSFVSDNIYNPLNENKYNRRLSCENFLSESLPLEKNSTIPEDTPVNTSRIHQTDNHRNRSLMDNSNRQSAEQLNGIEASVVDINHPASKDTDWEMSDYSMLDKLYGKDKDHPSTNVTFNNF